MSIFNIGKKNKDINLSTGSRQGKSAAKKSETKALAPKKAAKEVRGTASAVLLRPHITEKAGILSGKNVYTFEIAPSANKFEVKRAILEAFKVMPVKVRIAMIKATRKHLRGRQGLSSGGKKAYVYLKEGDKIEFI